MYSLHGRVGRAALPQHMLACKISDVWSPTLAAAFRRSKAHKVSPRSVMRIPYGLKGVG